MIRGKMTALAVFIMAFSGLAQITASAYRLPSTIEVNGDLSETVWANAERNMLKHDVGMQLTHGSIDDHADASCEFSIAWDDEGFYCASWNRDDVHNAPWTPQPGMTNHSWKDDGHEWWISSDFNDVWEDASPKYYGQFGWQVWKGWVWDNGGPDDNYVAYRNDNGPYNTTTVELKEQGFWAPYTSSDGINFNVEAQWKWSSFFFGAISTPSAGKEIGFNIGLTDNDGGDAGDAWLRWAEGNHTSYQGWGKVTLSSENVKIRSLRRTVAVCPKSLRQAAVFDVLGRKIVSHTKYGKANAVLFTSADADRQSHRKGILVK